MDGGTQFFIFCMTIVIFIGIGIMLNNYYSNINHSVKTDYCDTLKNQISIYTEREPPAIDLNVLSNFSKYCSSN